MRPQVAIIGVGPAGSDRPVEHAHRLDIRSQSSVKTDLVDL